MSTLSIAGHNRHSMWRGLRSAAFLLSSLLVLLVAGFADAQQPTVDRVYLVLGKSRVLEVRGGIGQVIVGDPDIADAVIMTEDRFYVLGRGLGTTNVQVISKDDRVHRIFDIEVGVDLEEVAKAIASAVPQSSVRVHSVNGRVRLSGSVPDKQSMERAESVARKFTSEDVINSLRISDPKQVYLKVEIIEASRSIGQEFGIDLANANVSFGATQIIGFDPSGSLNESSRSGSINTTAVINAMVKKGLARYLASPTLTALSGETASFLAGGETPIPVDSGANGTQITYKEFGVRLSFTPTVKDGGLINLKLQPEVSQIDLTNSYSSGSTNIPGFSTRRASTTIELRSGQSFVIAGLLQTTNVRQSDQYPGLGNLPILGPLFRASTLRDTETELLVIVTPHLTRPVSSSAMIETPAENTKPSNALDFFLKGKLERPKTSIADILDGKGVTGSYGPILTLGGSGSLKAP